MNSRSLFLLAGATALVAIVAAMTLRHRESAVQARPGGDKLFPGLAASINDVTSIKLKRKDGECTLQRTGETWGLVEKKGYPVEMAAVRKSLIGISDLKTAEERTDDPKLYSKLGVDDPGAEGSTSTLVTLLDASGKELASLIVGKEHSGKSFSGPRQIYVRRAGEARSWLASGEVDLHEKSIEWLDKKILEVKRERVRAVEVRHADGEVVLVDRDKPETNDFTLHDIPEGQEPSFPSAPSALGSALEWLNLEDVVPVGEVDMSTGTASTTKFSCFDGLTITATTKNDGEKTYARFEAAYEKPPERAGPPPPPEGADQKDGAAEGEKKPDGDKKDAPEKPKTKTPEEVQKEVADLNARFSQWSYVIPSYNKASFQKKKAELLKDKAPPPAPAGPDDAPTEPAPPGESPRTEPPQAPVKPPQDAGVKPGSPPESKPPRFGG
jgi:hypothetical protein